MHSQGGILLPVHLVDDDEMVRECISEIIANAGYNVISFDGGQAYINYMNEPDYIQPSILITDIDMPCINGFDLIKYVLDRRAGMNISIISGHAEHLAKAESLNIRMLTKPFHPDDIIKLISRCHN